MTPTVRTWSRVLCLTALLMALPALAQPRAWLDRDRIGAGETVTLNIETTGSGAPDYTPLQHDFVVSGHSSRSEFQIVNGRSGTRNLYAVALRPKRDGVVAIPSLPVGSEHTPPLSLTVEPAGARIPSRAGDDVFIESGPDDVDPYVQQPVGWVVRLYSAAPLLSGQLIQPAPEGAALQQVGEDARYWREIAGRRYEIVERRYLLIPERSGVLTVPGARFDGRGTGGLFDDLFGDRGAALSAQAAPRVLQVQPVPADAPQPWMPLRELRLRYVATPDALQAGRAGTLTIEAVADGASAAQMPELQLPPIDGVQVFADPVQADETFRDGRPRVKLTRRFSLVPARAGTVTLPDLRIDWWDVRAGAARSAHLPSVTWSVAAADASSAASTVATPQAAPTAAPASADARAHRGWIAATLLFAVLWLLTLLWALHHRHRIAAAAGRGDGPEPASPTTGGFARHHADLRRALEAGDLGDVAEALCAMATPPVRGMDELLARLSDPAQANAVEALQRARWGGGDGILARRLLRAAFAQGPRWRALESPQPPPLPPLYPPA